MFQIDIYSRVAVYEQLEKQIEAFILNGIFKPGQQLPSVRNISVEHAINPRTILKAYTNLSERNIISAVPGKGYFVCSDIKPIINKMNEEKLSKLSELIKELAQSGIEKEDIIKTAEAVYKQYNEEAAEK